MAERVHTPTHIVLWLKAKCIEIRTAPFKCKVESYLQTVLRCSPVLYTVQGKTIIIYMSLCVPLCLCKFVCVCFNVKVHQGFSGVFRHGFFRIFDYKFLQGYSQEVCIEGSCFCS